MSQRKGKQDKIGQIVQKCLLVASGAAKKTLEAARKGVKAAADAIGRMKDKDGKIELPFKVLKKNSFSSKRRYSYRPNGRKKAQTERLIVSIAIGVLALALFIGLIVGIVRGIGALIHRNEPGPTDNPVQQYVGESFAEGVSINGMALAGLNPESAEQQLIDTYEADMTAQIKLTFGENSWHFTLEDIAFTADIHEQVEAAWAYGHVGTDEERQNAIDALQQQPVDLALTFSYDRDLLVSLVQEIKQTVDRDPVNATMQVVEIAKFSYTDSENGYSLDADKLVSELEEMIKSGRNEEITIEPDVVEPEISRQMLEDSTVLLGECATSLAGSSSTRTSNVNLALSFFNFTQYEPGDVINFNKTVGKRTEANGFKRAPEYAGSTVIEGVGGGTCQASTTIYGAAIRAGLQVLERHPHTMTVGYVQASQDAAVSDGDKNLRLKNTTESTLYVFTYIDQKHNRAVCKMFGKPIRDDAYIEIESVVLQTDITGKGVVYVEDTEGKRVWYKDEAPVLKKEGKPGLNSKAYRIYYSLATGEELSREKLSTDTYKPEDDTYWIGIHER